MVLNGYSSLSRRRMMMIEKSSMSLSKSVLEECELTHSLKLAGF